MSKFKIGEKVVHKLTKEQLVIKRAGERIYTCIRPETKILFETVILDVCICIEENLELIETKGQLTIF